MMSDVSHATRAANRTTVRSDTEMVAPEVHPATGSDGQRTLVTFRIGWQTYALPLECVERALRMVAITAVPEAPAEVLGLIDLEGEVIPVVDLRRLLGLAHHHVQVDDRLIVVRVAHRALTFPVDEARAVLTVSTDDVESPPATLARARPLSAVIRRAEGLVLVLDAARLLADDAIWQMGFTDRVRAVTGNALPDDVGELTRIRGIGRVYAGRLASGGMTTFDGLAAADPDEIVLLLGLPPARRTEVASWIEQAREIEHPAGDAPDTGGPP